MPADTRCGGSRKRHDRFAAFVDRLFCVVVRSRGLAQRRKNQERGSTPVLSIPATKQTQRLFDRLLLFAAETTGALVVPTPPGLFSFASIWYQCPIIMKTLLLLRHAKAEHGEPGLTDLNRALNERGKKEAQSIGTFIRKQNVEFELVLCSTALRARETAELALAAAEASASVHYDQRLYEASPEQLLEVISEVEDDVSTVLLVGHNPGIEQLLRALTGEVEEIATGTLAKIDLDADAWSNLLGDKGSLDWIQRPQALALD